MNFTEAILEAARASLERIDAFVRNLEYATGSGGEAEVKALIDRCEKQFQEGLDDDFNYAEAVAAVFNLVREGNALIAQGKIGKPEADLIRALLQRLNSVVDYIFPRVANVSDDAEIDAMVHARDEARRLKNWSEADRLRHELAVREIILEDRAGGTAWRRK
jgi:cysteinyl-tRNA synthetase